MRAQDYADVVVTPYMREMAIKSYPFMFEAYQVMKSFANLMVVVLKAILNKLKQWTISLTEIVVNIARAIKWNEIRTALQKYVTNAAVWANNLTL